MSDWIGLPYLPAVSMLVAVISLVRAYVSAKRHSAQLADVVGRTETIFQHLTTKHLGRFPRFLPDICECIKTARKEILIACDYPGYGHFSDYHAFTRYIALLKEKKAEGVRVYAIVIGRDRRLQVVERQFGVSDADWERLRQEQDFEVRLRTFERVEGRNIRSMVEFNEARLKVHDRVWDDPQWCDQKAEIRELLPLHCWIADRERAVFSIPSLEAGATEHGFETRDASLSGALVSAYRMYAETASPRLAGVFAALA